MPSVRAVIGCGKISITNCGWKQNAILLAYITSGSDSRTFVFHCMCRHIYLFRPLLSWWTTTDTIRHIEREIQIVS